VNPFLVNGTWKNPEPKAHFGSFNYTANPVVYPTLSDGKSHARFVFIAQFMN
jgi:hypothetical protein